MTTAARPRMSNRTFGVAVSVFVVLGTGIYGLTQGSNPVLGLAVAGVILSVAFVLPSALLPFNLLFAFLAGKVARFNNTVLMLLVFAVVMTPMGLLLRRLRRDPLHRKIEADATTYWIPVSHRTTPDNLHDQF